MSANFPSRVYSFYISNVPSLITFSMKIVVFEISALSTYSGSELFTTFFQEIMTLPERNLVENLEIILLLIVVLIALCLNTIVLCQLILSGNR